MAHKYQCKRFDSYESVWKYRDGYGPGAFMWAKTKENGWEGDIIMIRLPDGLTSLYVSTDPNMKHTERTVWHWDGDREIPTLNPSINNPPDGWHGWLRAGRLISV